MAFYDWDGNGKKDIFDDYIEYNIYRECTKDMDDDPDDDYDGFDDDYDDYDDYDDCGDYNNYSGNYLSSYSGNYTNNSSTENSGCLGWIIAIVLFYFITRLFG